MWFWCWVKSWWFIVMFKKPAWDDLNIVTCHIFPMDVAKDVHTMVTVLYPMTPPTPLAWTAETRQNESCSMLFMLYSELSPLWPLASTSYFSQANWPSLDTLSMFFWPFFAISRDLEKCVNGNWAVSFYIFSGLFLTTDLLYISVHSPFHSGIHTLMNSHSCTLLHWWWCKGNYVTDSVPCSRTLWHVACRVSWVVS